MGGNLTVLSGMVGSDYLLSFEGKILFLEDIDEAVYRVDRMLTQLKLAGLLQNISGLVFAACRNCKPRNEEYNYSLKKMLKDQIVPLGVPAFFGSYIGHLDEKYTLPLGISAEIDAGAGTIQLLEVPVG